MDRLFYCKYDYKNYINTTSIIEFDKVNKADIVMIKFGFVATK